MALRIKYIVPYPLEAEGLQKRAVQATLAGLQPETEVECVGTADYPEGAISDLELMIYDMNVTAAGMTAEDEGFDAVVMDTVSDSGLAALRSRLSIPVVGPGQAAYLIAGMLGRSFSVLTYGREHRFVYWTLLKRYGLSDHCASVRPCNIPLDIENLFDEREELFASVLREAKAAISEDGADVLVLGSTTMYQVAAYLTDVVPTPVVNPGPLALKLAETLVLIRLSHSKRAYRCPIESDRHLASLAPVTR